MVLDMKSTISSEFVFVKDGGLGGESHYWPGE
jgi:hypothetical protein